MRAKEIQLYSSSEFYLKERLLDEDEFLVLACDGVWDVMSNEDICQFVAARMRITDDLELIANEVIDTCLPKVRLILPSVPLVEHCRYLNRRGVVTT